MGWWCADSRNGAGVGADMGAATGVDDADAPIRVWGGTPTTIGLEASWDGGGAGTTATATATGAGVGTRFGLELGLGLGLGFVKVGLERVQGGRVGTEVPDAMVVVDVVVVVVVVVLGTATEPGASCVFEIGTIPFIPEENPYGG